jgi:hypothetical protein
MSVSASLFVADDLLGSISGKANLVGVFTNDIAIFADETLVTQLVFLFRVEGAQSELPRNFKFEIDLPGERTHTKESPVPPGWQVPEGRDKWVVTHPILLSGVTLRLGKIEARVILEREEGAEILIPAAPWIILAASTASQRPSEQSLSAEPPSEP